MENFYLLAAVRYIMGTIKKKLQKRTLDQQTLMTLEEAILRQNDAVKLLLMLIIKNLK